MLAAQAATANDAARAANETANGALLQADADATAASVVASNQNIDPAIAGNASMMSDSGLAASPSNGEEEGDEKGDGMGKKGYRRELSTSKRAAQNRAAQVRRSCHVDCIDYIDGERTERSATVETKRTPPDSLCFVTSLSSG